MRYYWTRALVNITGIIFFSQLLLELAGMERKAGWEYTTHVCGALFAASVLFAATLVVINAYRRSRND